MKNTEIKEYIAIDLVHNFSNRHIRKDIIYILEKRKIDSEEGSYYSFTFKNERTGKTFTLSSRSKEKGQSLSFMVFYDREEYISYLNGLEEERRRYIANKEIIAECMDEFYRENGINKPKKMQ